MVDDRRIDEGVRELIAQVLMVKPDDVTPEVALVGDLGAESIDFLDLVFRIEDIVGRRIPVTRWDTFVRERLPNADLSRAITVAFVVDFARWEAARTATA